MTELFSANLNPAMLAEPEASMPNDERLSDYLSPQTAGFEQHGKDLLLDGLLLLNFLAQYGH